MSNYYSISELKNFGFSYVGENVRVSRFCNLYDVSGSIGDGTRIDDYTLLKGELIIGKKVHICSHSSLSAAGAKITIGDLSGIGVNNIFYTASDDMLVPALCGPLVNKKNLAQKVGEINIGNGVALGGRNTVMPSTNVGEYSAFGLAAILSGNYESFAVYMNINGKLKKIAKRDKEIILNMANLEL
jgi:acetyltransferase-like isoleucine patch superfamily enzyme